MRKRPLQPASSCGRCAALVARLLGALALTLFAVGSRAHELPVRQMVNAMARVEGRQADLVARIPMDLLRGAGLPAAGGHYDIAKAGPSIELALALLADSFVLAEDGVRLVPVASDARLVAEDDKSFDRLDHALAAARAPVDAAATIRVDTGYLEVRYRYPIASQSSQFEIQSKVAVDVGVLAPLTIRFQRGDEAGRAMIIEGGADLVDLDPAWYRAAASFVRLGVEHILTGTDHLLFLLCLVVVVRRVGDIVPVVTAFTIAHSLTLIGSALGLAPKDPLFPPLVEAAIAASIVYTAIENVVSKAPRSRWLLACLFGLVHGFGFSSALGESLQFAGRHLLLSLLAFNVGIEAGQLGVLCVGWPILYLLRRWLSFRTVTVAASAFGIVVGSMWLVERWQTVRQLQTACSSLACNNEGRIGFVVLLGLVALASFALLQSRRHGQYLDHRPEVGHYEQK
jgi:hypothetical protein